MSDQPIQPRSGSPHAGPAHFWERFLSRRQFMQTAGATGLALGTGLGLPASARADKPVVDPKPIPGLSHPPPAPDNLTFHSNGLGPADQPGHEPSLITDFNGFTGVSNFTGTGTGTGFAKKLSMSGDMRFMKGVYVGVDGKKHKGAFAFI
jgi:TAT (twin-arginine translocation) pathway signal sequence